MSKTFEGALSAKGLKFAVVSSRFNDFIGDKLLSGALDTLRRSGAATGDIDVVRVPGAMEMPLVVSRLVKKKYDAVICVGAIIRGSTPHFDYVAGESAKGIQRASIESGVPVAYGVITADNIEQAIERAGTKAGNKGSDAALTAIETVNLLKSIGGK
jgi:6,7-dimethyl-8-ribityllumazine synthase